ncbi:unnamed protein product [Acanthoscelides obtectus]|uniref:tRNA (32-2'-O)-methyltransferase regulator THADA n=1 Tax=Acanthoscelides obtectus TaxID=200917 RepID=A0A9P0PJL0_ACAOB|nr:unnamed protein product [Acanthoscelides obtectus]CAK1653900.1 Thyroid adenoma-associated protein homolog [Acanthoscelides obtectus]
MCSIEILESGGIQFDFEFTSEPISLPENGNLANILQELKKATKENDQKKFIKELVDFYKGSTDSQTEKDARNAVLDVFSQFSNKKVLKKYLQNVVGKLGLYDMIMTNAEKDIFIMLGDKKCNIPHWLNLCNFVCVMQNYPNFNYDMTIKKLFSLYLVIFEQFAVQLCANKEFSDMEKLSLLLNSVTKEMVTLFGKNVVYVENVYVRLVIYSYKILVNERVGFDLKVKVGLILTHCLESMPESYRNNFIHKDCPVLDFFEEFSNKTTIVLSEIKLDLQREEESTIVLYSSMLSVIPQNKLVNLKVKDRSLMSILYSNLICCAKRRTGDSHIVVEISRTLSIKAKQLITIPKELIKPMFLEGIAFVWFHIDHFIDTVRNYAKAIYTELIDVASYHRSNGHTELINIFIEKVKVLRSTHVLRFIALEYITNRISAEYLLTNFEHVQNSLISLLLRPVISEQASKTYICIMEKHFTETNREIWISNWVMPIGRLLRDYKDVTNAYQTIIIAAFKLYPAILRIIFPAQHMGITQEYGVLLKCLRHARQHGLESKIEMFDNMQNYWRGLVDKEKMIRFMVHQNDEIRLSALASIVESQKTTALFLTWELDYLRVFMRYNITSHTPCIRKQIVTLYKKALTRYSAGMHAVVKDIEMWSRRQIKQGPTVLEQIYTDIKTSYGSFIVKFTKQLIKYLTFDANYPRRATSLELLLVLKDMVAKEEWMSYWTEEDVKNCHCILYDGYESNKKMALEILITLPPGYIGFTDVDSTLAYIKRCMTCSLSLKPSETLTAAYLLEMCTYSPYFKDIVGRLDEKSGKLVLDKVPDIDMIVILISKLMAQRKEIGSRVTEGKVAFYGILLSIRYILEKRNLSEGNESYTRLFGHISTVCLELKDAIMPIVCNPSPEGYIPENDVIHKEGDASFKAQATLVYAWRTMKEMTLLLAEMVEQTVKLEDQQRMLDETMLIKIGEFFINVFIESKHRGVYEQAFVGFRMICGSFWRSSNPKLNTLPKVWLQDALDLCSGESKNENLCVTRRSAGVPFLVTALLSSEPVIDKKRFHECVGILFKTCRNTDAKNVKSRTICMNTLTAICRLSSLGECVASYVGFGMLIAISGFSSPAWGIRNAATLLFSCLITRIFGVQRTQDSENLSIKNRMTVKVFFSRYPEVFKGLLQQLAEEIKKRNSLMLHPILMIICRLYPSQFEGQSDKVDMYIRHLMVCLSNPVYKTRELAARATVSLLNCDQIVEQFDKLFSSLKRPSIKDNECHGILLQVRHLLDCEHIPKTLPLSLYIQHSIHLLPNVGVRHSHLTVTLYMEVLLAFLIRYPDYSDLNALKNLTLVLSRQIASNTMPLTCIEKFSQTRFLLLYYITLNKFQHMRITFATISSQIMCHLYGQDPNMKRFCLNILIHLNQRRKGCESVQALYRLRDIEIPKEIITVMDTMDKDSILRVLKHIHQYVSVFLRSELRHRHYIQKQDELLFFLLLMYYPCALRSFNQQKQKSLDELLNFCQAKDEDVISAAVTCISVFLTEVKYQGLQFNKLMDVLVESASPAASESRRYAVTDLLVVNYKLMFSKSQQLDGIDIQMLLNIVMVLLEDEEDNVRKNMSNFSVLYSQITSTHRMDAVHRCPVIPERAREDLLMLASTALPQKQAICFLFSWSCRTLVDTEVDSSGLAWNR